MTIYAPVGSRSTIDQPTSRRIDVIHEIRQMMLILGVLIDNVTMEDAFNRIERFVRKGRKDGSTHQVITINTDFLVRAQTDARLRTLLQNQIMVSIGTAFAPVAANRNGTRAARPPSNTGWLAHSAADFLHFTPLRLRQWWLRLHNRADAQMPLTIQTRVIGQTSILNLSGALTFRSADRVLQHGQRALRRRPSLTINLADVTALDCVTIGTLMQLRQLAEAQYGDLRLVGIRKPLRTMLDQLQLTYFFNLSQANMMFGY